MKNAKPLGETEIAVWREREKWIKILVRWGNAGDYRQMAIAQALIMEGTDLPDAGVEIVKDKK